MTQHCREEDQNTPTTIVYVTVNTIIDSQGRVISNKTTHEFSSKAGSNCKEEGEDYKKRDRIAVPSPRHHHHQQRRHYHQAHRVIVITKRIITVENHKSTCVNIL